MLLSSVEARDRRKYWIDGCKCSEIYQHMQDRVLRLNTLIKHGANAKLSVTSPASVLKRHDGGR